MKLLKSLDLRFADSRMETEYSAIKKQSIMRDFEVTVIIVFLVTLTVFIENLIKEFKAQSIISGVTLVILACIFMVRKVCKNYIEYLALFEIIFYDVYRLYIMEVQYPTTSKAASFFSGYTYAIIQLVLLSKISKTFTKISVLALLFAMRFAFIYGWIDPKSTSWITIIRSVITDVLVLYYFYFDDKIQRKNFENLYQSREELVKFKELLDDSLPQSVTVVDCENLEPLFANKAFMAMFESLPSEFLAPVANHSEGPFCELTHQANLEKCKPYLGMLQVEQLSASQLETQLQFAQSSSDLGAVIKSMIEDGLLRQKAVTISASYLNEEQRRSYEVKLKKIRWNGQDAIAILFNDITDQENLIALKLASANKDKIIGTVSHELRTPLSSIIGLLNMAEKIVEDSEALEYIRLSKDNAQLLHSLVNSHLDLQQITAGKFRLNPASVNIYKVVNDITRLFQFQTKQKGIYLEAVIDKDVHEYMMTDEGRLKQILINLIGNAIKFTSKGGIRVEMKQSLHEFESDYLYISVIDTGIGIKEDDVKKLFTPFESLEDGRKVNKSGVGLGLTIASVLAALLAGKKDEKGIEVQSVYGEGSTFSFKILKQLRAPKAVSRVGLNEQEEKSPIFEDDKNSSEAEHMGPESSPLDCFEESFTQNFVESKYLNYISSRKTNAQDLNLRLKSYKSLVQDQDLPLDSGTLKKIDDDNSKEIQDELEFGKSEIEKLNKLSRNSLSHQHSKKDYIVIVDDDPFNLLVTGNLIREFGFPFKSAIGGKEAIETVKSLNNEGLPIKVILMDCQMPIMDGYATTKILKEMMKRNEIPQIPVIALTANGNNKDEIQRCSEAGMEDYLTKPASQKAILKALKKLEKN